ncbi:Glutaredoxin domain-containing cysteine-rich protein 1 [Oopsacas minuta]|uniref:Glutaredoxin domain-containing cysteine-rich protein 1 n=1 Tax=Oopsacas minuta TaxID=111878 RepID=A0AAV7JXN6_9METZ|nr:Glutaredoxin domain-containing cysteine-rich protein 1 [Oopsacas minuta]
MSDSVDINQTHSSVCNNVNSVQSERESVESVLSCFSEMEDVDFEEVYNRLRLDIHETLDEIVEEKMQALHKRIQELEQENQVLLECKNTNEQTVQSLSISNSKLKFEVLTLQEVLSKQVNGESDNNHISANNTRTARDIKQLKIRSKSTNWNNDENNPIENDNCFTQDNTKIGNKTKILLERSKILKQNRTNSFSGFSTSETSSLADMPGIVNKHKILGRTGTIRGFQNTVKKKVSSYKLINDSSFLSSQVQRIVESELENEEDNFPGKLVVYTTSSILVREIFDNCKLVLEILTKHKVQFEERDLFINPGYECELKERFQDGQCSLPILFLRGYVLGDCNKMVQLDEEGELIELLKEFKNESITECLQCRGKRFTQCLWCQGSKKGLLSLKCSVCNKNGLQPCFECNKQEK